MDNSRDDVLAFRPDRPDDAPEADAVEKTQPVAGNETDDDENDFEVPLEANPADAVEQRRRVGTQDEDDYR